MIVELGRYVDRDMAGRPARTQRLRFGSQQEQVVFLRGLVNQWAPRLAIREQAAQMCQEAGVPPRRRIAQALAIGNGVKQRVYYVNEHPEIFQTPARTLQSGIGDCDDFTVAIAALCESIGIPTRLVAMSVRPAGGLGRWVTNMLQSEDHALTHIYPEALPVVNGRRVRVCLDATGDFPVGTDPIRLALRRGRHVRTFAV